MKFVDTKTPRRRSDLPGADNEVLQNLERYWQTLRRAQKLPSRNDIQPAQIDAALPHAFILQRVAPGIARLRVAGQQLHDLLKMDARGMPISTFFEPHARNQLADLIESAFNEPAIIAFPLVSPGSLIRPALSGTLLMLPLRDDRGEVTRILGAIVTEGQTGNRPRRFVIPENSVIRKECLSLQLASTQDLPEAAPKDGSEQDRPEQDRPVPRGRVLRLVVDNS